MTDYSQPLPPRHPYRPRRAAGPDLIVIVLAALIAILLVGGSVTAAVKASEPSSSSTRQTAADGRPSAAPGSAPSSSVPSSTAHPPTTAPGTTLPGGTVAPVNSSTVPRVTAPPVTAQKLRLAPSVIAALVNPSVVDIDTRLAYQHAVAAGTGMVLSSDGIVLTNNHVIDGATTIGAVSVGNGRAYPAHVLGVDPSADVALIKLDGAAGLTPITTSNAFVNTGDPVVTIGNAGGVGGTPSVTSGTVVSTNQSIIANDPAGGTSEQLDGLIETTAALQPGDSGGPLANGSGQVIGMDTAASVAGQPSPSVSFAIPIAQAMGIARQIEAGQASSTVHLGLPPFLGVTVTGSGSGGRAGALVGTVVAGGPAAGAGIAPGALIVAVNGQTIDSPPALTAVLRQFHPGDTVTVQWFTPAGALRSARVTLGTGPAD